MSVAIWLALAASLCTATSSVCQRLGAASLSKGGTRRPGFDPLLVFRLATRPVWLVGFAGMLLGFVLQVSALRFGPLAVVQPVLAVELVFVFGYLAAAHPGRVGPREWLPAVAMSAGVAIFLAAASPSGGQAHAPAGSWWLAAGATLAVVSLAIAASGTRGGAGRAASPGRRAALLGIASGVGWGFVATVIKELSSHVGGGPAAIFTSWSVYALMAAGAAGMLLTAHAMAAGPLAASQPGLTVFDPVTATLLGVFLFGEHLANSPWDLAAEFLGLVLLAGGAWALSRSRLVTGGPE
jgi:drug/metabolite transporter (DMT)-like permease